MLDRDAYYLNEALNFAREFENRTHPNPCVACVLVKDDEIVSYGASEASGKRHAEVVAIDNAKLNNIDVSACCAYVTLEPCCHFGKTPPCTSYILEHGIKNVVVGLLDPNPLVSGNGVQLLRDNGVEVRLVDDIEIKCKIFLSMRGFLNYHQHKKPWIRLKLACSIDGVMSLSNGVSKWITGSEARLHNQVLRARAGAVLTGINTIIDDNPLMNVRSLHNINSTDIRQPLRVVLDSNAKGANLAELGNYEIFHHQDKFPLLWICGDRCNSEDFSKLQSITNAVKLPCNNFGKIDLNCVMDYLYSLGINEIHVESGRNLTSAFLELDLFDEVAIYQAPVFLGNGNRLLQNQNLYDLNNINKLEIVDSFKIGEDLYINMLNNKIKN
jgi:diaminohydroxyphosphoribosylaminopyrimidine deaminase/5-amino-6-(5-phosphoribosylamino)uracil reductase